MRRSKPQICFNAMLHDLPSALAQKIGCLGGGLGSGSRETALQDCLNSELPKLPRIFQIAGIQN